MEGQKETNHKQIPRYISEENTIQPSKQPNQRKEATKDLIPDCTTRSYHNPQNQRLDHPKTKTKQERRERERVTKPPRTEPLSLRSEEGRRTEPPMLQTNETHDQRGDEKPHKEAVARTATPSTPSTLRHVDSGLLEPNLSRSETR
ncbi:predicted protein [Arabidopsis lyrata subsp. lyrata]|uniref:Predicted protein n=1 Tax=Arabidopsis lyrata subsp. lyrata TaxID=81972 RepID=D7L1V1_ARALL|nr:predicted protein [Arabidopsis lyrata subsp. lyrata]